MAQGRIGLPGLSTIIGLILLLAVIGTAVLLASAFWKSSSTPRELFTENRRLEKAIKNLTAEERIGYATVLDRQEVPGGELHTTFRFVQTAPGKPEEIVASKTLTLPGSIPHFDAVIVNFENKEPTRSGQRALYFWRRVYTDAMAPREGVSITAEGAAPQRYRDLTDNLRPDEERLFWESIWALNEKPGGLAEFGIRAIYGNVVYLPLEAGETVEFRINAAGRIIPVRR